MICIWLWNIIMKESLFLMQGMWNPMNIPIRSIEIVSNYDLDRWK